MSHKESKNRHASQETATPPITGTTFLGVQGKRIRPKLRSNIIRGTTSYKQGTLCTAAFLNQTHRMPTKSVVRAKVNKQISQVPAAPWCQLWSWRPRRLLLVVLAVHYVGGAPSREESHFPNFTYPSIPSSPPRRSFNFASRCFAPHASLRG